MRRGHAIKQRPVMVLSALPSALALLAPDPVARRAMSFPAAAPASVNAPTPSCAGSVQRSGWILLAVSVRTRHGSGTIRPQHPVTCPPQSGVPTARETSFLTDIRGYVPGDDTRLLAIGRDVCVKLLGGEPVDSVVPQAAAQMGVANETAGQVVDAATGYMCPGAPLNE